MYRFIIKVNKIGKEEILFKYKNLFPEPCLTENKNIKLLLLGKIYNSLNEDDWYKLGLNILNGKLNNVAQIDGNFLIFLYLKEEKQLFIINDRFSSIPFFYCSLQEKFIGSIVYLVLLKEMSKTEKFSLDEFSLLEFIHFQRLHGEATYDNMGKYLTSASILKINIRTFEIKKLFYWLPDFQKGKNKNDLEMQFISITQDVLKKRTEKHRNVALLLSGGMDSRYVVACSNKRLNCYTIGDYFNNEVMIAEKVAKLKNFPHFFLKREEKYYWKIFEKSVYIGSGMYNFLHGHFFNLSNYIKDDLILTGHGFDYFFQGLYEPFEFIRILRFQTYLRKRIKVKKNRIVEFYINRVKYRLKDNFPFFYIRNSVRKEVFFELKERLKEILHRVDSLTEDEYDLWDYLILHNIGRHYTFLNLLSIKTWREECSIALDNSIFDLFWKTPVYFRKNALLFRKALVKLDRKLAYLENSNTNMPGCFSPLLLTIVNTRNFLLNKVGFNFPRPPTPEERSWPPIEKILYTAEFIEGIKKLKNSPIFDVINFLDEYKVKNIIDEFLEGNKGYSKFVSTLLTVDEFLRLI